MRKLNSDMRRNASFSTKRSLKLASKVFIYTILCILILDYSYFYAHSLSLQHFSPSPVLIVVIAIGVKHDGIAARSQRAYAKRHGYRLIVQRKWRGTAKKPKVRGDTHAQKLIACEHARGEDFVLVLDTDVVISPWTPPIHLIEGPKLGGNVGIVDEDQPTPQIRKHVEMYLLGEVTNVTEYYSLFGDVFTPAHGMLNSGVLLIPKKQYKWMRDLYYAPHARRWFEEEHNHVDQPVIGSALMKEKNYRRMNHAWNRGWVYYKISYQVGGPQFDLANLFRSSYFVHFYWHRRDIFQLERWMKDNNLDFSPQAYATNISPRQGEISTEQQYSEERKLALNPI